jgi:hypothetical protein
VTDRKSPGDRNNREKITRARQAAEDPFKRTQQTTPPEFAAPASSASSTGQQASRRQPRVLAVAPRVGPSAKTETPAKPKPMRRKKAPRRGTGAVPSSQVGRVRALTNYGMTRAQVAEVYGVTIEEIDRIIKGPAYPTKSR